jgi:uncharacterized peroxidase-related enzyme
MTRVPVHTVDSAPEGSRDALKALEAKFGKVLNIHGAMAHAPAVLNAYAALQTVIGDYGTFDAATREAIALVVGNIDRCTYCQSAHTVSAKKAGFSGEQAVTPRDGSYDEDPKLAALLALVRESAANVGNVQDATWLSALDAGWSDEQLTEVAVHIALNLFTNHFNHLVDTGLDVPAAPGL